jgi:penicillin-binding protein 2
VSGADGIEAYYNNLLAGKNGLNIVETDALGNINSSSTVRLAEAGKKLMLSVDKDIQASLYENIKKTVEEQGFIAGSGIIMDIQTGEVLALTTFPSYSSQIMSDGVDKEKISSYFQDSRNVFLDRPVSGLYAPGSILKQFIAIGALEENIISPDKKIESKGLITIPNPYFPDQPSIFRDWKKHGWTDMREAIAVSSDVYFYAIGGGYEDQKGMGIDAIDRYVSMFGFGAPVGDSFFSIKNNGTIPTPEWKKATFNGDPWRLGDTYTSSIGQFGFQVTAVQAVRAVASLVNGGKLIDPVIIKKDEEGYQSPRIEKIEGLEEEHIQIAREGMRMAVTEGTLTLLNFPDIEIAAKSGTAEVGSEKKYINSWSTGYFPYRNPRYAFAIVLEKGPSEYIEGASGALQRFFYDVKDATSTTSYIK